jgi:hypothetical protein
MANAVILAVFSIYLLASIASSYKGRCGVFWFFGGEGHPCPRSEYVMEVLGFMLLGISDDVETWSLMLLALCILPLLGYLMAAVVGRKVWADVKRAVPNHGLHPTATRYLSYTVRGMGRRMMTGVRFFL